MRFFGRRNSDAEEESSAKPSMYRLGFASGVFAFISLIGVVVYVAQIWVAYRMAGVDPPRMIGAPLHVTGENIAGVFVLTIQEETRPVDGGSRWLTTRGFEQVSHVDLWRFD